MAIPGLAAAEGRRYKLSNDCEVNLLDSPLTRTLDARKVARLKLTASEMGHFDSVVEAMQSGNWGSMVYDPAKVAQQELPRIALHAYLKGQVTLDQFVTQAIRWAAIEDFPPEDLTRSGPIAAFSADGTPSNELRERFLNRFPFDRDQKLADEFLNRARALPDSEKVLWHYRGKPRKWKGIHQSFTSLAGEISAHSKSRGSLAEVLFPSYGLIATYFSVSFAKNDFHLIPQLGKVDIREAREGILEGGRVLTLHLWGLPGEREAHGGMERFESIGHDVTHSLEAAVMPKIFRLSLIRFLDVYYQARKGLLPGETLDPKNPGWAILTLTNPIQIGGQTFRHIYTQVNFIRLDEMILDLNFTWYFMSSVKTGDPLNHQLKDYVRDYYRSPSEFFARNFRAKMELDPQNQTLRQTLRFESDGRLGLLLWDLIENPVEYTRLGVDIGALAQDIVDPIASLALKAMQTSRGQGGQPQ